MNGSTSSRAMPAKARTICSLARSLERRNIQGRTITLNILVSTPAQEVAPESPGRCAINRSNGSTNRSVVTASSCTPNPNSISPSGYAR